MSIQTIYAQLVKAGLSDVGAVALMGNMQAESGMNPRNVEDERGYSDEEYTAKTDAGIIDFVGDRIGYGLCQWTDPLRKHNFISFARRFGKSIGDETLQVDFCVQELKIDFPALWLYLCTATGVYEATVKVCKEYEMPKNPNYEERAQYANGFYMTLGGMDVTVVDPEISKTAATTAGYYWPPRNLEYGMFGADVLVLQALLVAHNHNIAVDGQFGSETRNALAYFQADNGLEANGKADRATWKELTAFD